MNEEGNCVEKFCKILFDNAGLSPQDVEDASNHRISEIRLVPSDYEWTATVYARAFPVLHNTSATGETAQQALERLIEGICEETCLRIDLSCEVMGPGRISMDENAVLRKCERFKKESNP